MLIWLPLNWANYVGHLNGMSVGVGLCLSVC